MRTRFLSFALAVACLCLVPAAFAANDDCLVCHADKSLSMTKAGRSVPLFVDAAALKKSPHADLGCVDCHAGFDASNLPHKATIEPVDCLGCHSDPAASHPFHAAMQEGGKT